LRLREISSTEKGGYRTMDEIKYYMEESILSIKTNSTVAEAAKFMAKNRVGALLVKDEKKIRGIVTDLDFSHKVIARDLDPKITLISDVMSHPLITLDCENSMLQAFKTMRQNNIRHLVISENKKLAGMLSIKDFANYYNSKFGNEDEQADTLSDSKAVTT
jgi:signal-transduction protein with cAMP-binding, CBS, and nucleotidyltransferase domain